MQGMNEKIPTTDLGKRLVQLRKARGLTQQQLADKLGLTRRAIVYYERESDNIPTNIIVPLAKALNVSIEELLGIKQIKNAISHQDASLWRKLKVLETFSEKDKKAVLQYVQIITEKNKTQPKTAHS
jgi:transcriptional regulator with XRE-family HTH domain